MNTLLNFMISLLLRLRYRIELKGYDAIAVDSRPVLFLPNHPALIDPVIVMTTLFGRFRPRPLADENQVDRMFVRRIMKVLRAVVIPDPALAGRSGKERITVAVREVIAGLQQGDSILLYPAGRLSRSGKEEIGANSAVESIVRSIPDVRIVLIRTTGLWGSGFSRANGIPSLVKDFGKHFGLLLLNGLFFMPRRRVTLEFHEPSDFPRSGDRLTINRYLEDFYNRQSQTNMVVPHFWWQGRSPQLVPEPERRAVARDTARIPEATRELVVQKLAELSGERGFTEQDMLARDLGLDSLALVEFAAWLETEFGIAPGSLEGLQTVADCILAAGGIMPPVSRSASKTVSRHWFHEAAAEPLHFPEGHSVADLFLRQATKTPDQVVIADQISGEKTYRQIILAIYALLPELEKLENPRVGIMLPASVTASIAYLAVLFAGKEPVMVNWTTGGANMKYSLESIGVKQVLTAGPLLAKLAEQGVELGELEVEWLRLERIAAGLSRMRKLRALLCSRGSWRKLKNAAIADTAAILFTSGSEAHPKAVPLSHANFLANGRDFMGSLSLQGSDKLLGILPVFHSLGLAGTVILPLCTGLKTVYWPNPTEGAQLAALIKTYRVTALITTPTFLNGILRAADEEQLAELRLVFSGAEKCPDHVFGELALKSPKAILCEGYGVTECSPVITVNTPDRPVRGAIGSLLPSMDALLIHPETREEVGPEETGQLLVRGPNVFAGYLGEARSPFVTLQGKEWYDTGDLMTAQDGIYTFAGRLKRFVKIGGEMISLPAIEQLLESRYRSGDELVLAVVASRDEEYPELALMTTLELDRQEVNQVLRNSGFSPLHNIRQVVSVPEIPILGTGKTDYRKLTDLLEQKLDRLKN